MAAPTAYTPEIADAICDAIATQSKGLHAVLNELGQPINPATWYRWLRANEELRERYARARADQAQVLAEEIVSIADTPVVGEVITESEKAGVVVKRGDMIEHRKLQIDARKFIAAKLLPKVYGDKVQAEVTGSEGGPIQAAITVEFVKPK